MSTSGTAVLLDAVAVVAALGWFFSAATAQRQPGCPVVRTDPRRRSTCIQWTVAGCSDLSFQNSSSTAGCWLAVCAPQGSAPGAMPYGHRSVIPAVASSGLSSKQARANKQAPFTAGRVSHDRADGAVTAAATSKCAPTGRSARSATPVTPDANATRAPAHAAEPPRSSLAATTTPERRPVRTLQRHGHRLRLHPVWLPRRHPRGRERARADSSSQPSGARSFGMRRRRLCRPDVDKYLRDRGLARPLADHDGSQRRLPRRGHCLASASRRRRVRTYQGGCVWVPVTYISSKVQASLLLP
jgi:hypothetical protein